jgi:ABC-type transporter Mla MlaB component
MLSLISTEDAMMIIPRQLRHLSIENSSFSTLQGLVDSPSPEVSIACASFVTMACLAEVVLLLDSTKLMFKISTIETSEERRLVVEGTLTKPWVTELRKTWNEIDGSLDGRRMVIDLTNATVIDSEGEAAILQLMREGAKFRCSGVLTKHVLQQLAQKCQTSLNCVLERTRSKH